IWNAGRCIAAHHLAVCAGATAHPGAGIRRGLGGNTGAHIRGGIEDQAADAQRPDVAFAQAAAVRAAPLGITVVARVIDAAAGAGARDAREAAAEPSARLWIERYTHGL